MELIWSQSPQIGSVFPTCPFWHNDPGLGCVAIPSNRVSVSYILHIWKPYGEREKALVAIPSNRVSVSYILHIWKPYGEREKALVAIPSNRVSVSYSQLFVKLLVDHATKSQSPQIGSVFPTCDEQSKSSADDNLVAIPSNRVNVSYQPSPWLNIG